MRIKVQKFYHGSHTPNRENSSFESEHELFSGIKSKTLDYVISRINSTEIQYDQKKKTAFELCVDSAMLLANLIHVDVFIETTGKDEDNPIFGYITFQSDIFLFNLMNENKKIKENLKRLIDCADEFLIETYNDTKSIHNYMSKCQTLIKLSFAFEFF